MARAKKEVEQTTSPELGYQPKVKVDVTIDEEIQDSIPEIEEEPEVLIPEPQMKEKKISIPLPDGRRKLQFKKVGGGSLRGIPGYSIIKPGQVFDAYLEDISPRFLTSLKCLEADLLTEQLNLQTSPRIQEVLYVVKQRAKKGIWDVIKPDGDAINEADLTEEDAINLAKALNN